MDSETFYIITLFQQGKNLVQELLTCQHLMESVITGISSCLSFQAVLRLGSN